MSRFVIPYDWGETGIEEEVTIEDIEHVFAQLCSVSSLTYDRLLEVFLDRRGKPRRIEELYSLETVVTTYQGDGKQIIDSLLSANGHLTLPEQRTRQDQNSRRKKKENGRYYRRY